MKVKQFSFIYYVNLGYLAENFLKTDLWGRGTGSFPNAASSLSKLGKIRCLPIKILNFILNERYVDISYGKQAEVQPAETHPLYL